LQSTAHTTIILKAKGTTVMGISEDIILNVFSLLMTCSTKMLRFAMRQIFSTAAVFIVYCHVFQVV